MLALFLAMLPAFQSVAQADVPTSGMTTYELNGFKLSGSEYWPYVGDQPFNYPADVLWGFQGEENECGRPAPATAAVQACAKVAYDQLHALLANPPAELQRVLALGATPRFYLWTNDYSQASANRTRRANSMWHWNRGDKNYAKGYWKWESVLTQDGQCLTPQTPQLTTELRRIIGILERNPLPWPEPAPSTGPTPPATDPCS